MPEHCAAYSCRNRRTAENKARGITFHKFPKNKDRRKKWELALRRKKFTATDASVICSEHFKPDDFDMTGQIVRLREGVIPSIFNFPVCLEKPKKRRTTSTSGKDDESLSVAPKRDSDASTSHSQSQPLPPKKRSTRSTSRKADESLSVPQNDPETSTSHSKPQPIPPKKRWMTSTTRKADEILSEAPQHEPEASTSHSKPQHISPKKKKERKSYEAPKHEPEASISEPQHNDPKNLGTASTTRNADESLSEAPQHAPQASTSQPQAKEDHCYALFDSPSILKTKLTEALARTETLEREKKNALARETRAKIAIQGLLEDLKKKNHFIEELKKKLDFYSTVSDIMPMQGHEYTKEYREFALTLHLHGPKAYNYLRETWNFPLPHPHTIQKWRSSKNEEPDSNTMVLEMVEEEVQTEQLE